MRVGIGVLLVSLVAAGSATAQDLCGNIRLSISEQIECRGRITNAMGEGDRARIQQEFEDRIRRANDQLITPPILKSQPPPAVNPLPNTSPPVRPAAPIPPDPPALPGARTNSAAGSLSNPPGDVAPRAAPPSGTTAIAPDLTAPDPVTPLPPISPIPPGPVGTRTPPK